MHSKQNISYALRQYHRKKWNSWQRPQGRHNTGKHLADQHLPEHIINTKHRELYDGLGESVRFYTYPYCDGLRGNSG